MPRIQEQDYKEWICASDANVNQLQGLGPDALTKAVGNLRAVAAHQRSSCPIDAIWSTQELPVLQTTSYMPGHGDHSICAVEFDTHIQKPRFRFTHVPKSTKEDSSETCVPWETLAAPEHEWQSALKHGNTAWNLLGHDVERFLMHNNHLQQRRAERNLGSAPSVKVSAHHMAPEQGLDVNSDDGYEDWKKLVSMLTEVRPYQKDWQNGLPKLPTSLTKNGMQ